MRHVIRILEWEADVTVETGASGVRVRMAVTPALKLAAVIGPEDAERLGRALLEAAADCLGPRGT
jgi:hypothetical protein